MKHYRIIFFIAVAAVVSGCSKNKSEIDQTKPVIDMSYVGASPVNCDTVYYGDDIIFKAKFSDNVELGSFSIIIHDNFDGHSHSTEAVSCGDHGHEDDDHNEVEAHDDESFGFVQDYTIPAGSKAFEANISIPVPAANDHGEKFAEGAFHLFISLTDKQGWSSEKGLSLVLVYDH